MWCSGKVHRVVEGKKSRNSRNKKMERVEVEVEEIRGEEQKQKVMTGK